MTVKSNNVEIGKNLTLRIGPGGTTFVEHHLGAIFVLKFEIANTSIGTTGIGENFCHFPT